MRVGLFLLIWLSFLSLPGLLEAQEVLGRVVSLDPQHREVKVRLLCPHAPEVVWRDEKNFSHYRLGELVKIEAEGRLPKLKVKRIKPLEAKDRTGVRKRLKRWRRCCGGRRH